MPINKYSCSAVLQLQLLMEGTKSPSYFHTCDKLLNFCTFFYIYFNPMSFATALIQNFFENKYFIFFTLFSYIPCSFSTAQLKITYSSFIIKKKKQTRKKPQTKQTRNPCIKPSVHSEYLDKCSFKSGS